MRQWMRTTYNASFSNPILALLLFLHGHPVTFNTTDSVTNTSLKSKASSPPPSQTNFVAPFKHQALLLQASSSTEPPILTLTLQAVGLSFGVACQDLLHDTTPVTLAIIVLFLRATPTRCKRTVTRKLALSCII
jgi:hypothetical protein